MKENTNLVHVVAHILSHKRRTGGTEKKEGFSKFIHGHATRALTHSHEFYVRQSILLFDQETTHLINAHIIHRKFTMATKQHVKREQKKKENLIINIYITDV